jgi:hypothetical protein
LVSEDKNKYRNHKNYYHYEATKRKDLQKVIIPFFKSNPVKFTSKQRALNIVWFSKIISAKTEYALELAQCGKSAR